MTETLATTPDKTWIFHAWWVLSAGLIAWLAYALLGNGGIDETVFMPGPLSNGHHQLQLACDSCHVDALGGGDILQQSCIDCHGDERKKPFDSHPISKFEDPRNADRLKDINATQCITCHTEHKPQITAKNGVTQPKDFCVHCHAEIGDDRPSHQNMEFATCASSGCHNFHNNRDLYTDFLLKHLHEPANLERQQVPEREFAKIIDQLAEYPIGSYPLTPLTSDLADGPVTATDAEAASAEAANENTANSAVHRSDLLAEVTDHWAKSAHATSGVNCTACHLKTENEAELQTTTSIANNASSPTQSPTAGWTDTVSMQDCQQCHQTEIQRFQAGKHGMRLAVGLTSLTVDTARLPMHESASHRSLDCHSCHAAHDYNTVTASADACLECHADEHSLAWRDSPHAKVWKEEVAATGTTRRGASCATCHMPRVERDVSDWLSRLVVDHNQSANLSPNSKMLRGTCMHCHGMGFSINALADEQLIQNNFNGQPSVSVESLDLAERDQQRDLERRK